MTDHYAASVDLIEDVHRARVQLRNVYLEHPERRDEVGRLNAKIGDSLKLAEVHATLSVAQGLTDLINVLEYQGQRA